MWAQSRHRTRDHLPFGCSPLRLGRRLDRGHIQANPMTSCRHGLYYHHVSSKMVRETRGRLTDDLDILASLLVTLVSAADSVGEAVTLMSEGLTPLTRQSTHHQLILKREEQYAADAKRDRQALTPTYIFHPRRLAPVPTHNPLSRVCSTSSAWHTLGTIWRGEGSSALETPTSDSPSLGAGG